MLTYNDEGKVCYNFGKNKGRPVTENPSYAMWVNNQDFHCSTKQALKEALAKSWTSTSTL
jgi:DNA polymerase-3 subunit epsilon